MFAFSHVKTVPLDFALNMIHENCINELDRHCIVRVKEWKTNPEGSRLLYSPGKETD
jgi:hypothetical protein